MMLAEKRKTMPHFSFAIRKYLLGGNEHASKNANLVAVGNWADFTHTHTLAVAHWKSEKNGRKDNCVQHCVCAMALRCNVVQR